MNRGKLMIDWHCITYKYFCKLCKKHYNKAYTDIKDFPEAGTVCCYRGHFIQPENVISFKTL